jgi:hypothetical protein
MEAYVHYRTHICPSTVPILSQINSVHVLPPPAPPHPTSLISEMSIQLLKIISGRLLRFQSKRNAKYS